MSNVVKHFHPFRFFLSTTGAYHCGATGGGSKVEYERLKKGLNASCCQAFTPYSNVCEQDRSLPEWSNFEFIDRT
jgi:hypothetical protein